MNTHPYLLPLEPPGTEHRQWRCEACKQQGRLEALRGVACTAPNAAVPYADPLDAILAGHIQR